VYARLILGAMCVGLALMSSVSARAEVSGSTENGFTVRHSVTVPLPPPAAWAALVDVGRWWDPAHTYSGESRNMRLDPFVGGCMCERWGMYNGTQHLTVVNVRPPWSLRLTGALGPLQQFAVTGVLTWDIESGAGGSRITMTYTVGGFSGQSLAELAIPVDGVMVTQVERLARFIGTGSPEAVKVEPKTEPKR